MNNIEKAIEIRNARIRFVSLVDKAANLQSFLVTKNKDSEASFKLPLDKTQKQAYNIKVICFRAE